jgi:hypothetical protein
MQRSLGYALCFLFLSAPALAQEQDKQIGEAPEERNADDIFLRGQRVLLAPGDFVLDVGQFYSRNDTLQLAIADDVLQLATREDSVLTTTLVGRLGVWNETELYAGSSFHRLETRLVGVERDLASNGRNLAGDAAVGVRRTLLREASGRPDVIASVDAVIPTDDDRSYALGGGVSLVKSIDPVVLFAGASYGHGFRRNLPDGSRLAPRNSFAVSLGYGLALNDTIAISTAASGVFTRTSVFDVFEDLPSGRTETFNVRFALTSALAKGLYIEPSVTVGLSGPGQSVAMGVTLPLAF